MPRNIILIVLLSNISLKQGAEAVLFLELHVITFNVRSESAKGV